MIVIRRATRRPCHRSRFEVCHENANVTLIAYANIRVGMDKPDPDLGRFVITKDPRDWGVFKIPTLRDVERSAPYMHDGSLQTLDEVVDYYDSSPSNAVVIMRF